MAIVKRQQKRAEFALKELDNKYLAIWLGIKNLSFFLLIAYDNSTTWWNGNGFTIGQLF